MTVPCTEDALETESQGIHVIQNDRTDEFCSLAILKKMRTSDYSS